jgi:hypothetical protein
MTENNRQNKHVVRAEKVPSIIYVEGYLVLVCIFSRSKLLF